MPPWPGLLALQAASVAGSPPPASATLPGFVALPRCAVSDDRREVVVCASRADRYRLPPDRERDASVADGAVRGETPSAAAALRSPARCGIFAGERRCGRKEAAAYGYGDGRDPVTALVKLAGAVLDPDGR